MRTYFSRKYIRGLMEEMTKENSAHCCSCCVVSPDVTSLIWLPNKPQTITAWCLRCVYFYDPQYSDALLHTNLTTMSVFALCNAPLAALFTCQISPLIPALNRFSFIPSSLWKLKNSSSLSLSLSQPQSGFLFLYLSRLLFTLSLSTSVVVLANTESVAKDLSWRVTVSLIWTPFVTDP